MKRSLTLIVAILSLVIPMTACTPGGTSDIPELPEYMIKAEDANAPTPTFRPNAQLVQADGPLVKCGGSYQLRVDNPNGVTLMKTTVVYHPGDNMNRAGISFDRRPEFPVSAVIALTDGQMGQQVFSDTTLQYESDNAFDKRYIGTEEWRALDFSLTTSSDITGFMLCIGGELARE